MESGKFEEVLGRAAFVCCALTGFGFMYVATDWAFYSDIGFSQETVLMYIYGLVAFILAISARISTKWRIDRE